MVNAFWLDRDLEQTARWLVDDHVTSSILECGMVLTTVVQQHGYPERDGLYYGFDDHPLTEWAARAHENWAYLYAYTETAHDEWRYRWNHDQNEQHACWAAVDALVLDRVAELDWPATGRTDPPQLTGDWSAPDYVDAYRFYYANEKRHLFEWAKDRERPPWIEAYTIELDR